MRAGDLIHTVELQKPVLSQDPTTGEMLVSSWDRVAVIAAHVEPLSVRDFMQSQAEQSEVSARIKIRYRKGITANMRIVFRGQIYNIAGVLPDNHTGLDYMTIPVTQGVNEG